MSFTSHAVHSMVPDVTFTGVGLLAFSVVTSIGTGGNTPRSVFPGTVGHVTFAAFFEDPLLGHVLCGQERKVVNWVSEATDHLLSFPLPRLFGDNYVNYLIS